jgi:hypothetical protein
MFVMSRPILGSIGSVIISLILSVIILAYTKPRYVMHIKHTEEDGKTILTRDWLMIIGMSFLYAITVGIVIFYVTTKFDFDRIHTVDDTKNTEIKMSFSKNAYIP